MVFKYSGVTDGDAQNGKGTKTSSSFGCACTEMKLHWERQTGTWVPPSRGCSEPLFCRTALGRISWSFSRCSYAQLLPFLRWSPPLVSAGGCLKRFWILTKIFVVTQVFLFSWKTLEVGIFDALTVFTSLTAGLLHTSTFSPCAFLAEREAGALVAWLHPTCFKRDSEPGKPGGNLDLEVFWPLRLGGCCKKCSSEISWAVMSGDAE